MKQTTEIRCPCCNEEIIITFNNGELEIISTENNDSEETNKVLRNLNIEFG